MISTESQNLDLVWIKNFSEKFFQIMLLLWEIAIMLECTVVTNENTVIDYNIGGLVFHTVNTVLIEFVISYYYFQVGLKIWMLYLRQIFREFVLFTFNLSTWFRTMIRSVCA